MPRYFIIEPSFFVSTGGIIFSSRKIYFFEILTRVVFTFVTFVRSIAQFYERTNFHRSFRFSRRPIEHNDWEQGAHSVRSMTVFRLANTRWADGLPLIRKTKPSGKRANYTYIYITSSHRNIRKTSAECTIFIRSSWIIIVIECGNCISRSQSYSYSNRFEINLKVIWQSSIYCRMSTPKDVSRWRHSTRIIIFSISCTTLIQVVFLHYLY